MHAQVLLYIYQHVKFEIPSLTVTDSKDMILGKI